MPTCRSARAVAERCRAAVLGRPVAHSLSPALHSAAYRATGLVDWSYDAHDVGADELGAFVARLDGSWRGLSLTMPLKEAAFDVATSVSETARLTGAVNTLVRRTDLGWDADNTDVHGIEAALAEESHDGSAVLLGGGATARSAIVALARMGVTRLGLAVRGEARPQTLRLAAECGVAVEIVPLSQWADHHHGQLVVSTLPPEGAAVATAALGDRPRGGTLMDVVYADWPTPLAQAAEGVGMTVVSGLDMLVNQAAEQFRLFTGRTAPLQAMYAAGRQALGR
jgi:shikimate dehydrogenase